MPGAFELLHPKVQRKLWDMRWTELRPIQTKAIEHLIGRRGDCIIASPTAGGKTEAAFLPIISIIADDSLGGVRAMYISPLKALINDQFRRLEDLCSRLDLPIHKWHGDVSDGQRRALLDRPSGILLITPESLEAMFVLRPTHMPALFQRLAHVVVDEVHAFMGTVRGAQLQSQLHRLHLRCSCNPVRVGLSATIGDPKRALSWLRPHGAPATLLDDDEAHRSLALKIRGFWRRGEPPSEDETDPVIREVARSIVVACRGATNLVFANAKSRIEELADELKSIVDEMSLPDEIVVHHGSLSRERREYAEDQLRSGKPCTAVCSNTLELGIDVGQIDTVVQVAAPWSVASLIQRIGRSGRREGQAAKLRGFFIEDEPSGDDDIWKGLHLDFLQGLAMVELMLDRVEHFIEPPDIGRSHHSTRIHQLLSILAETGGTTAPKLFACLSASGAFGEITRRDFAELLRALAQRQLIQQLAEGDIVLGVSGQKLIDHYSFYAAFRAPVEFRVVCQGDDIGTLPEAAIPPPGDHVLLAGRRWQVQHVDGEARVITVIPSRGRRRPRFSSLGADMHPRVHRKMRDIACGTAVPSYIDENARDILKRIRTTAEACGRFQPEIRPGESSDLVRVFLWAGSKIQRTLFLVLREADLHVTDEDVGLEVTGEAAALMRALQTFVDKGADGGALGRRADDELNARIVGAEKFDEFVPDSLWRNAFVADRLDIPGARALARKLLSPPARRLPVAAPAPPLASSSGPVTGDETTFSPSDLVAFADCAHLTQLERAAAAKLIQRPYFDDPALAALVERGRQHEANYLARLEQDALAAGGGASTTVTRIEWDLQSGVQSAARATAEAMARGDRIIYQATFLASGWRGHADFLVRIDEPSPAFPWSYEPADAKLARHAKAGAILQLCAYAEMVSKIQQSLPEHIHLILGGPGAPVHKFRLDDFFAYYRWLKDEFLAAVSANPPTFPPHATYPEPVERCVTCNWSSQCIDRRHTDDHLSLVAGITGNQRVALERRGVSTMSLLSVLPLPVQPPLEHASPESVARSREQARLQVEGRNVGRLLYELLDQNEPGLGLCGLPAPSPGDLFLDLEGDPFALDAGLEYLFGVLEPGRLDSTGNATYHEWWAQSAATERVAFEAVIDFIMERRRQDPTLHVFHYNHYEVTAFKRLMCRYGTREPQVDELLRGGVFIDLYRVVRQGVRASVESYSIKKLEPLYEFTRDVGLRDAGASRAELETWLELDATGPLDPAVRETVRVYNRDDCRSAWRLRNWLEDRRSELAKQVGSPLARPKLPEGQTDGTAETDLEIAALFARLRAGAPDDARAMTAEQTARVLLADLLEYHRREDKSAYWEFHTRCELTDHELIEDRTCIGGLKYVGEVGKVARSNIYEFEYAPQEHAIEPGQTVFDPRTKEIIGTVYEIDEIKRRIRFKRTTPPDTPIGLVPKNIVRTGTLRAAIRRVAEWVAQNGIDAVPSDHRAIRDLLLRRPPRLREVQGGAIVTAGEDVVEASQRLAASLDAGVLAVQGPPGSGKTYAGARMALALLANGKRVGITANSHRAIKKFLSDLCDAADGARHKVEILQAADHEDDALNLPCVTVCSNADSAKIAPDCTANVIAGTAWLWAREEMAHTVDVLFVDEATQVSLANAVASSHAARSIVLLGDPRQLDQPVKGIHPPGAEKSVLEHVLGDEVTIAPDRGLFLDQTWRLHPDVCAFTSKAFYAGRLRSRPGLERQRLHADGELDGSGIRLVPVAHEGNANQSDEEAQEVRRIVDTLLAGGRWTDGDGVVRALTIDDILIITPYNAQVATLVGVLPRGARVGTVDKFQGQQAPVSIYSMASSTVADAPRGMSFLYSPNRLNVATSRARCLAVVVACPEIFRVSCHTPEQIRLANSFCQLAEFAQPNRVLDGRRPG